MAAAGIDPVRLPLVRHAEHAHEAIRGSRLVSFSTGGHGLLSQMDAVRQNVNEFLDRLESGK
jgi:hypothetical protein